MYSHLSWQQSEQVNVLKNYSRLTISTRCFVPSLWYIPIRITLGTGTIIFLWLAWVILSRTSGISGFLEQYIYIEKLKCAISQKVCSFQELAHITYGQKLRWFVNIVFVFGSAGTAVLHLRLVCMSDISNSNPLIFRFLSSFQYYWDPALMITYLQNG